MAELKNVLALVLVNGLAERLPEGNLVVRVNRRVVRDDSAAYADGHEGADDGAYAAARELDLPVDARLRAGAVVVVETARDVRAEDSVLDRQVSELERLKD